jgi:hypothetical protein
MKYFSETTRIEPGSRDAGAEPAVPAPQPKAPISDTARAAAACSIALLLIAATLALPRALDANGDGVITAAERLRTVAHRLDADSDDAISIAEFVVRAPAVRPMMMAW